MAGELNDPFDLELMEIDERLDNWPYPPPHAGNSSHKRSYPFDEEFDHVECSHLQRDEISLNYVPETSFSGLPLPGLTDNVNAEQPEQELPVVNCLLGSILHVNAQLSPNEQYTLPSAPSSLLFAEGSTVAPLQVDRAGKFLELKHDGFKFARLNKVFSNDLCPLLDQNVALQAFLDLSAWNGLYWAWNSKPWQSASAIFEVELNAYCPRSTADDIGKALSKKGIFLQRPIFSLDPNFQYYNPQFFVVPGFTPAPNITGEGSDQSIDGLSTPDAVEQSGARSRKRRVNALENVLDSLSHTDIEHEISADESRTVKSRLLPHQQTVIDFILQRESGNVASELTMWKENTEDADEPFYQHVLTGARSPRRDEVLGGIVADDMGLGKSLVMLSTIATSTDRAKAFANLSDAQNGASQDTSRKNSRATLILAPSTLLIDSWVDEVRRHLYPGALRLFRYLGPERYVNEQALFENDIVFTTYATAAKEMSNMQSPLRCVRWFRLILDEAHEIRNRLTRQYEAVYALPAKHRWCLTGTPIQNTLDDLSSLISFLRVPILEHVPTFRKFIVVPTISGYASGFRNLQILLKTICIRRTRKSIGLHDPEPQIRLVSFHPQERAAYEKLWDNFRRDIQKAVSGHKAQISAIALRCIHELRLFCNNGPRQTDMGNSAETEDERFSMLELVNQNKCAVCDTIIHSIDLQDEGNGGGFLSSCNHLICHTCLPETNVRRKTCEFCAKQPRASKLLKNRAEAQNQSSNVLMPSQEPSKLQALLLDICKTPGGKCIVFSSWKKTLDIASTMMRIRNLHYDIIYGSLTLKKRINVLNSFKSPTGPNILLMTLGTGAVGLNLAVASRIYLLEPQWNPFLEAQAMARALRIGQEQQVTIIRYITEKTVEHSQVLKRQEKKTALAVGGFGSKDKDRLKDTLTYFGFDPASIVRDDWNDYGLRFENEESEEEGRYDEEIRWEQHQYWSNVDMSDI